MAYHQEIEKYKMLIDKNNQALFLLAIQRYRFGFVELTTSLF